MLRVRAFPLPLVVWDPTLTRGGNLQAGNVQDRRVESGDPALPRQGRAPRSVVGRGSPPDLPGLHTQGENA